MADYSATGRPQDNKRGIAKQVRDEFDLIENAINTKSERLAYTSVSTTSLFVGTGLRTLTIETGKELVPGMTVFIADATAPSTNNMSGTVTSYVSTTGILKVNISSSNGSGTLTSWTVGLSNPSGVSLVSNTFSGHQNFARATVASDPTLSDIWNATGNQIDFTGIATVTAFPNAPQGGAFRELICAAACSFTDSANLDIDGYAIGETMVCAAGDIVVVRAISTTGFRLTRIRKDGRPQVPAKNSVVIVSTGNGHGSTNTRIRRWTTTLENTGTAITYADSATLGGSFTINEAGIYAITVVDSSFGAAIIHGISVNSNQLTTSIASITAAHRLVEAAASASDTTIPCSVVTKLAQGDVVRAHNNAFTSPTTAADKSMFSIRKILDV